jgi:DNA-binding NarL/FixJ family response regulator
MFSGRLTRRCGCGKSGPGMEPTVRHGGIAPASRHHSRRVLTLAEREDISRGLASGCSMRIIAQQLSRAASTVSRGGSP